MNRKKTWITNVQLVLPQEVIKGNILIEDGIIKEIITGNFISISNDVDDVIVEGTDMLLLPGLIDIHCDAIEKEVEPRPNALFPMDMALYELEKKLAAVGITTMYHSLSLGVGLSLRGDDLMVRMVELISAYQKQSCLIRHRVHLRYEITHFDGLQIAEDLIKRGLIHYLSYMNHAPGLGQYKRPGAFEAYVMKNQGVNKHEVEEIIRNVVNKQEQIDWKKIERITELAKSSHIRIASHDDDSIEQVDTSMRMGATVCEFPLNLGTASYASDQGISVCVGAPNVVRGSSHDKNMKAIDAIQAGKAQILCSDYLPSSIVSAIFKLNSEGISLSSAVNMATLNPAIALGIHSTLGSIEIGKQADFVLIEKRNEYPLIRKTIVNGMMVYQSEYIKNHIL